MKYVANLQKNVFLKHQYCVIDLKQEKELPIRLVEFD